MVAPFTMFLIYIYDDINDVLVSLLLSLNIFLTFLHLPIAAFEQLFAGHSNSTLKHWLSHKTG